MTDALTDALTDLARLPRCNLPALKRSMEDAQQLVAAGGLEPIGL